jgi:hypothetical protein
LSPPPKARKNFIYESNRKFQILWVAELPWVEKHKYKLLVPKRDSFYKQTNERKVDKPMKKVKRKE